MSWSAPEDWARWDPERLMVCPYDEVHMIKAKRFQHHLLKCRKNHPDKDFVNCPFNAKHVMLRSQIRHHVSRCPDRSVIEQYNYKGSEKDEDGFYFKGDTSVPSYHKSEQLQEPSESWDSGTPAEEQNLQWSEYNDVDGRVPHYSQRLSQSPAAVTDILSLSPEERERFKQKMRRDAALRSVNPGIQPPSQGLSTCQGYNRSTDIRETHLSPSTNPALFRECAVQDSAPSSSEEGTQSLTQRHGISQGVSKPRNPIFEYCIGQMRNIPENAHKQSFVSNNEQDKVRACTSGNLVHTEGENGNISSSRLTERSPNSSSHINAEFRGGFIESEMANLTLSMKRGKPKVPAISSVCGHPTSPTSTGVKGPHLAGVGRARLLAEARKNNFGGICNSPPKATGSEAARTASSGRGRGVLNYFV